MTTEHVTVAFKPDDYMEAKALLQHWHGSEGWRPIPHGAELRDGIALSEVAVDIAKIGIPALAALVALWLGRGKRITVRRGDQTLELRNLSEGAAKDVVAAFLNATNDASEEPRKLDS